MILGGTGSRDGLTNNQLGWLHDQFESGAIKQLHHGACQGADAAMHQAALDNNIPVHVWPPVNTKYVAEECLTEHPLVTVHAAMPYLNRNREIVRATQGLVAFPKQDTQPDQSLWGGTWYTVNFAERVNKPVVICYPNGDIEYRKVEGTQ